MWGRCVGLFCLVPGIVFYARGMLTRPMVPRVALYFGLVGCQVSNPMLVLYFTSLEKTRTCTCAATVEITFVNLKESICWLSFTFCYFSRAC